MVVHTSQVSVAEKVKKYSRFYFEGSQSVGLKDTVQNVCDAFIASHVNFLVSLFSLSGGLWDLPTLLLQLPYFIA